MFSIAFIFDLFEIEVIKFARSVLFLILVEITISGFSNEES
jgi:hypothetical protein